MIRTLCIFTLFALSSTSAFAKEGGAWDFEGAVRNEKIQLALEATRATTDERSCNSSLLGSYLRSILETQDWFVLQQVADKALSENEKACLLAAQNLLSQI